MEVEDPVERAWMLSEARQSLNFEAIENVAQDSSKFAKFCFLSGFAPGVFPTLPEIAVDATRSTPPEFKGWKSKLDKSNLENRQRLKGFLDAVVADQGCTAHLTGRSSCAKDQAADPKNPKTASPLGCGFDDAGDSYGSPVRMSTQIRDFGLLVGGVDAIVRHETRWGPPLHSGQRMFDDCDCVLEFHKDLREVPAHVYREAFIKAAMVTTLRESKIPFFVTDLKYRAFKLTCKISKGFPVIGFDVVSLANLSNEIRACMKQKGHESKDSVQRLKYLWSNPPSQFPRQNPAPQSSRGNSAPHHPAMANPAHTTPRRTSGTPVPEYEDGQSGDEGGAAESPRKRRKVVPASTPRAKIEPGTPKSTTSTTATDSVADGSPAVEEPPRRKRGRPPAVRQGGEVSVAPKASAKRVAAKRKAASPASTEQGTAASTPVSSVKIVEQVEIAPQAPPPPPAPVSSEDESESSSESDDEKSPSQTAGGREEHAPPLPGGTTSFGGSGSSSGSEADDDEFHDPATGAASSPQSAKSAAQEAAAEESASSTAFSEGDEDEEDEK